MLILETNHPDEGILVEAFISCLRTVEGTETNGCTLFYTPPQTAYKRNRLHLPEV